MITLKDYQLRVLDSLREFFSQCARDGRPEGAFQAVQLRNGRTPLPYLPVQAEGMEPDMPYVCLRVPTGGGKTLLACHAAGLAMTELLRAERAIVLWLVPSNTILNQTADALADPRHPYRRALEISCGAVDVVTMEDALRLPRATVDGQTVVIVSTIQSFRVEDTTGRKAYDQNGAFSEHLLNVPGDRLSDLLPGADGRPKPSLVNMLRLRRPIVIVDEAHNARTDLSFATLGGILPSCIVEFTATPARATHSSNVLHHVSAAELKAADMVKLPLRVVSRHPSQRNELLAEAIAVRADLERLAGVEGQQTGEYIRPILLLQADRVDACEPLRERLQTDFGFAKDEVCISVGSLDELKDVKDVASPSCPVRLIITVQKLREGWDCPFAYVLCSLRETRSATAIEQIVGRILRLPGAKAKHNPDLNCAYAFSVSESIVAVLAELRDALESNGFTAAEAERIILSVPQGTPALGSEPQTVTFEDATVIDEQAAMKTTSTLGGKVRIDIPRGKITVLVPLDKAETQALADCVKGAAATARVEALVASVVAAHQAFGGTGSSRQPTAYEQGVPFRVPLLCVREQGQLYEFENTVLLDHPWKLSAKDASLPGSYDPRRLPQGQSGVVDIATTGRVETAVVSDDGREAFVCTLHQQTLALGDSATWTVDGLVAWLDRHIGHQDIPLAESAEFLRMAVRGLMARHGITDVDILARDRFRLREVIETRIQQHRDDERRGTFQGLLLSDSALTVHDDFAVDFGTMVYEPSWSYEGGFQFKKHYFGPKPGELAETTTGGALVEEFQCAQHIDSMTEVKTWVRNLARKRTSFRLQTSRDYFYPDFVCQLVDGRVLAVEYKGGHLYTADDAEEKRAIGAVWEARSSGRCLFVMPTAGDFSIVDAKVRAD